MPSPRVRFIVLCREARFPELHEVACPDSEGGAVEGLGLPMGARAGSPEQLDRSFSCGSYAFSSGAGAIVGARVCRHLEHESEQKCSLDKDAHCAEEQDCRLKDVLRHASYMAFLSLRRPCSRMKESVLFGVVLADRIAELGNGVVVDIDACRHYYPHDWKVSSRLAEMDVREHVSLHVEPTQTGSLWLHTHGLIKFGRPELEMLDMPENVRLQASALMLTAAQCVLDGAVIKPGDRIGSGESSLLMTRGRNFKSHFDTPVLEFVNGNSQAGKNAGATGRAVARWYRQGSEH